MYVCRRKKALGGSWWRASKINDQQGWERRTTIDGAHELPQRVGGGRRGGGERGGEGPGQGHNARRAPTVVVAGCSAESLDPGHLAVSAWCEETAWESLQR